MTIRLATEIDILRVLANLTGPDYDEIVAGTGRAPIAIAGSFPFSTRVALLKDTPVALYGISHDHLGTHPFLLTTPAVRGAGLGRFIVEHGRELVSRWTAAHGPLTNLVYTKNHAHIRFVRAMGFTLGETRKCGPLLHHFTEFTNV